MTDLQCLPYRYHQDGLYCGNGTWYGRSHDCPWSNRWPCEVSPMRIDKHVWLFIRVAVSLLWMMSNCTLRKGWAVMVSVLTEPPGVILWGLYLRMWTPHCPNLLPLLLVCCLINLHNAMSLVSTQRYRMVEFGWSPKLTFLGRLYIVTICWWDSSVSNPSARHF